MRLIRILLALILLAPALSPSQLRAEDYPGYENIFLNDYARVIPPESQDRLKAALKRLKDSAGVEMTVVTLPTRKDYSPSSSIEAFAQGLFNYWGVGGKERNDGVLVLVATSDREMRVELGSAYNQGYDVIAQDIVNRVFEPAFRNGQYAEGIEAGVTEIIEKIALKEPKAAPTAAPVQAAKGNKIVPWLFGAAMALMIGLAAFGQRLKDFAATLKPCPDCGKRGLHIHRETVTAATATTAGLQTIQSNCQSCGWHDIRNITIPVVTRKSSDSSFGGGKSSGGGATGRW